MDSLLKISDKTERFLHGVFYNCSYEYRGFVDKIAPKGFSLNVFSALGRFIVTSWQQIPSVNVVVRVMLTAYVHRVSSLPLGGILTRCSLFSPWCGHVEVQEAVLH